MPEFAALLRLASDQRLAEHVSTGSERAFEVLYDRHHRPVLSFCRHMLGSREEAEDAVQHTFMAAYRDLIRSGPHAAVRPWLFVIARNRCISILRARRELPAESLPELCTDHLASTVATREELRAVLAGVARLPDDQRAALVLTELGDVSHDEIARILDCRREQVKSYVYMARTSLLADRAARETSCADIREQLTELRGGQLRRAPLRRHLHDCAGCREFREALRGQRRALGILLPVAPSLGLKRAVLGAALGGGGGAGGFTLGGIAATVLIVVAIPAGGVAVAHDPQPTAERSIAAPTVATQAATERPVKAEAERRRTAEPQRSRPRKRAGADTRPARERAAAHTSPAARTAETRREREASDPDRGAPKVEPDRTPGQTKPSTAPGQSRPKSAPGQNRPKPTPAHGKPSTSPGRSGSAPGRNKPTPAPAQNKPDAPPGKPDATPGNGPPESPPPHPAPATQPNLPQAQAPSEGHRPLESPGRSDEAPGRGRG